MLIGPARFSLVAPLRRTFTASAPEEAAAPPDTRMSQLARMHGARKAVQVHGLDTDNAVHRLGLNGGRVGATTFGFETTEVIVPGGPRISLPRQPNHFFYEALPSRDGSMVYAADAQDRRLVAYDNDGNQVWEKRTDHESNLFPLQETAAGEVFFSGAGFAALVGPDGDERWHYDDPELGYATTHCSGYGGDTAYLGGINRLVAAEKGVEKWAVRDVELVFSTVTPGPDGRVYAGAFGQDPEHSFLLCYDSEGHEVWRTRLEGYNRASQPALSPDGTLYQTTQDGTLHALDGKDGSLRWTQRLGDLFGSAAEVLAARPEDQDAVPTAAVTDGRGNVFAGQGRNFFCLDAEGNLRSRISLEREGLGGLEPLQTPHLDGEGRLLLHDGKNRLVSLDTAALISLKGEVEADAIELQEDEVRIGDFWIPVG